MSKTPVSLLQEYTAQHRLSTPDYTFYDVGHSLTPQFKCIVSLNNQTAEAVASNKKTAKHNAALKALQLLGCKDIPVDYVEECVTTPNTPISCEINTSPGSNYVGILNEYASTNRQNYPTYDCESMGLVTPTFVVHCYFMGLVTAGTALNKKSAKQESAKLMLESIDKKLPPLTPKIKGVNIQPKKLHLDEDEVKLVLTKFNELSVSNPNDYKSKKSIGFINQILNIPQIENNNNIDEIHDCLKLNGFDIEVFQKTPLILKLRVNNDTKTLFSYGRNMEEATNNMLITLSKIFL